MDHDSVRFCDYVSGNRQDVYTCNVKNSLPWRSRQRVPSKHLIPICQPAQWHVSSYAPRDSLQHWSSFSISHVSGVTRGGLGGVEPLPPKLRRPSKIVPNSTRLWKLFKIAEFRTPTPQDVRKKSSKILKLLPVHNCFTLAMTNKLVVIINGLKVPKSKQILLYEMKFLVPNYSCLQNPSLGVYRPQIPVLSVLCPQLNLLNPPPPNKSPGYATIVRDTKNRDTAWVNHAVFEPTTRHTAALTDVAVNCNPIHLSLPSDICKALHLKSGLTKEAKGWRRR